MNNRHLSLCSTRCEPDTLRTLSSSLPDTHTPFFTYIPSANAALSFSSVKKTPLSTRGQSDTQYIWKTDTKLSFPPDTRLSFPHNVRPTYIGCLIDMVWPANNGIFSRLSFPHDIRPRWKADSLFHLESRLCFPHDTRFCFPHDIKPKYRVA